nr:MAG TPA: hypothetical protein [Bacteriophage sp.]
MTCYRFVPYTAFKTSAYPQNNIFKRINDLQSNL